MEQRENTYVLDIATLARDVLKNWRTILLVAVMAAMVAYMGFSQFFRPQYSAKTTLVVSYTDSKSTVVTNWTAAKQLTTAFSQVLNSNIMKQKVTEAIGEEHFHGTIDSQLVEDTNLIVLTVTTDAPLTSYRALSALIENHSTVTDAVMSDVVISVLKMPAVPTHPDDHLGISTVMLIAALLGGLLVAVIEGAVSFMRDTVKNETHFTERVDAPLLGTVYSESSSSGDLFGKKRYTRALISKASASFGFVEVFKILRTKVEHKMLKSGAKVIMVTSMSAGEGKTTVSTNLALALAQKGNRVILVDGDLRRPQVYKQFGFKNVQGNAVRDLALDKISHAEIPLLQADYGLKVLAGRISCEDCADAFAGEGMKALLAALREQADFVVVDMPPFLFADVECMAQIADASLLVVKQNAASISDINDAVERLENSRAEFIGCVLNDVYTGGVLTRLAENSGYEGGYGYGRKYKYGYGYGYRGKTSYYDSAAKSAVSDAQKEGK